MLNFSCRISNRERYISLFPRECDEIFKYRYSNQFSLGSINLIVRWIRYSVSPVASL